MADVTTGITARRGLDQAILFADKGGTALNRILSTIADQKAAERMGSLQAALFLETHFSNDEVHSIPVVGSKQGAIGDGGTGNLPYDKYTKKIKTSDGERTVPGSWYTDVIHSTDEYRRIQRVKGWLKGEVSEGDNVPDDIQAIAKTGAGNSMMATLNDRVSDMRTGLTKGAMLFLHVEKIAALNPERIKVKMPYAMRRLLKDGQPYMEEGTNEYASEMVVTGSKIRLVDPASEFEDKVYSVTSFLALDPSKPEFDSAELKTIVNLDATTKRAPKGGDKDKPGTATDVKVPVTLEQVLTQFNALASGLNQEDDKGERMYLALLTKASGNGDEARETRMSISKVALALDALWTIIGPMHNRDVEAAAKASVAAQMTGT